MIAKPKIDSIKVTPLTPKVPAEFKHLLPTVLTSEHAEWTLSGVDAAFANAIRRTISNELPVWTLWCEYGDIETDDPFIIREMITKIIRRIPIDQTAHGLFELHATNLTTAVIDVKSGQINHAGGGKKRFFNETFTVCTLQPGTYIKIKMSLKQFPGFMPGDGMCVVACNTSSVAADQKPINYYNPAEGGLSCSVADPRVWKISFNTNGTMDPEDIFNAACDNLIRRVKMLSELLYSIENNNDEYVLTVNGETHTIGNLMTRAIMDLQPDIIAVTYSVASVGRILTIRVRTTDDINDLMNKTIKYLVGLFTTLRNHK